MVTRSNKTYDDRTFAKWGEFKTFIDKGKLAWSYRGQGDSKWPLSSSLERCSFAGPIERIDSIEHETISKT